MELIDTKIQLLKDQIYNNAWLSRSEIAMIRCQIRLLEKHKEEHKEDPSPEDTFNF